MRKLFVLLAPLALGAQLSATKPAISPEPSFDCAKASSAVERAICNDPVLSTEDTVMARLYTSARISVTGRGPSGQVQAQTEWLRRRASCEKSDPKTETTRSECLLASYRQRNAELALGAIPADRDFALKTLNRLDPQSAPLVEAMVLYADQPPGSNWNSAVMAAPRSRIMTVLEATWTRFNGDENTSFGREILKDSGITGTAEMFKGDHDFAYAIGILGTYSQSETGPATFPCSVLLRNPQLISAEGPFFGSSLDNFIPVSNCQTAMPPLPALDALVKAIWATWPQCEGTIRFAGYRSFATSVDAARIGQPIEAKVGTKALSRIRGVKSTMVIAAQNALAAHYRANLGLSPAKALATAHARIGDILSGAHECGG